MMNKLIKKNKRKMSAAFKKGNEFFTWYTQMYYRGYVIFKL